MKLSLQSPKIKGIQIIDPKLTTELKTVIGEIGLHTDFKIELRGYSSKYWGRYDIKSKKIILYILDEQGEYLPYRAILTTAVHEAIHHYQYKKPDFVRVKGIMHDAEFKKIEAKCSKLIEEYL